MNEDATLKSNFIVFYTLDSSQISVILNCKLDGSHVLYYMVYHITKTTITSATFNVQPGCHYCFMIQYMIYVGILTNTALQNGKPFTYSKTLAC